MEADFRGSGLGFPIVGDESGALEWVDGDDNVVQSVRLLLSTVTSERIMRPGFGTRVAEFLFEGDSQQNLSELERSVGDAVTQYEPRVTVERISSQRIEGRDGVVEVTVGVRILRTNTQRNLVFPFYVGTGEF
jgi:uncharacterized protein